MDDELKANLAVTEVVEVAEAQIEQSHENIHNTDDTDLPAPLNVSTDSDIADGESSTLPTELLEGHVEEEKEFNGSSKKCKMRTASDVISRILWDPDLPSQNFTIGYLDRFVGLTEKPFQFFSWEDLASVDYNVLAIPKHRIVYFKYRDVKVWDKNQRLDLVFRSTAESSSSSTDIRQLIQQLDEEHALMEEQRASELNESEIDDDSDSDSDVEINITQCSTRTGLNLPPARPNYFVAIRVTNAQVLENVQLVKAHISEKESRLTEMMMPDKALHITLAMLKLDNSEEVENANQAIQDCRDKLANYFREPIVVGLRGLAIFNGYVLYTQVDAPDSFYEMHKSLLKHLTKWKVRQAHEFDFVPHMTILKLTRSRAKQLQNPYVDPYVYVEYKELDFGKQVCDNLHMCEIGTSKRWDGFYNCASEIHFT